MAEKVIAVVGARLNSSRLPGKHLLPLAGQPLISRLVTRLNQVETIDQTIIATTDDAYNRPLVDWAESEAINCFAYDGDVNDLVGRVDALVHATDADIILYICGDCPLVEPSTIKHMIAGLQEDPTAECALLKPAPEGFAFIHAGFDIYRRPFWDRMVEASVEPHQREHLGCVFHSQQQVEPKGIAWIEEDPVFYRTSHRISVDTPSDYQFMSILYDAWYQDNGQETIVDLRWAIGFIIDNHAVASINQGVKQKSILDKSPMIAILVQAGSGVGMGHLSRMMVLARALQDVVAAKVHLYVTGDVPPEYDWGLVPHTVNGMVENASLPAEWVGRLRQTDCIVADVKQGSQCPQPELLVNAAGTRPLLVSIDHEHFQGESDLLLALSFYWHGADDTAAKPVVVFGWPYYCLKRIPRKTKQSSKVGSVIVLTGGGDTELIRRHLPTLLDVALEDTVEITWVCWPSTGDPELPDTANGRRWDIWRNRMDVADHLAEFDVAVCAYGVSLFECLTVGVPTVAFKGAGDASAEELAALEAEGVCLVAHGLPAVADSAADLCRSLDLRDRLRLSATGKLTNDAGAAAARLIAQKLSEARQGALHE